jgi:hypothetical protein
MYSRNRLGAFLLSVDANVRFWCRDCRVEAIRGGRIKRPNQASLPSSPPDELRVCQPPRGIHSAGLRSGPLGRFAAGSYHGRHSLAARHSPTRCAAGRTNFPLTRISRWTSNDSSPTLAILAPKWLRRLGLGSRTSLPSFPSVRGLFAPGRISLEIPSPSSTSWKLNNSPSRTFSSLMPTILAP